MVVAIALAIAITIISSGNSIAVALAIAIAIASARCRWLKMICISFLSYVLLRVPHILPLDIPGGLHYG